MRQQFVNYISRRLNLQLNFIKRITENKPNQIDNGKKSKNPALIKFISAERSKFISEGGSFRRIERKIALDGPKWSINFKVGQETIR